MSKEIILDGICKSYEYDLSQNFVAAAVKYDRDKNYVTHSGIAICFQRELYIFHYTGAKVKLELLDPKKWYVENKLDFIKNSEVASFYIYCEDISVEARPEYGFNYNGSYFLPDGKYYTEVEDYQFMSCVGFCLNVLTGAIESKCYIDYEQWTLADHEKDQYFLEHMESYLDSIPKEKRQFLKINQRRIFPIDYFTSSFFSDKPVTKVQIDTLKPKVESILKMKYGVN